MRYTILTKGDSKSNALKHKMMNYMKDFRMIEDSENPEIVISVGGDGTLLQAFHQYSHMLSKVAFVGVHTGHLGFYADWLPHEVEKLIIEINNSEFQVIEYPLLEIIMRYNDNGYETRYLALNEATMKTENGSTLVVDVNLRGKHFERFRGDGLCVSTPSGSTAYNKALGGALIHPSLEAMQITEIASINNRVFRTVGSPLVLPKHHTCLISPVNHDTIRITIDHVSIKHKNVNSIQYRVANEKVRFARFRPFPFWKRVHDSFISSDEER
ncbi:TPA: NAD kinase [Staphylococcus aureus]|nr:NAD kinase [Staphylococcus aureus]HCX2505739.1 NAD kinase [Staphylococcus aureus]HDA6897911.1 NAD kinase [Staphylococcus aureus]